MERIKKKIHSQSGASFLLALLAFLVAAVVSVVIVTAAVTNVKRIYSDREAQQDHLTLLSAAQLVRDEMEKTRYIKTTVTSDPAQEGDGPVHQVEGTFGAEMRAAVNGTSTSGTFDLEVTGLGIKQAVKVSFTMQPGQYKVVFMFRIKAPDGTLSDETLFLIMHGKREYREYQETETHTDDESGMETTIITVTETETYTWSNGIINAIGDRNE